MEDSSVKIDFDFVDGFVNSDRTVNIQLKIKDGIDLKDGIAEIFKNSRSEDPSITFDNCEIEKVWFKGNGPISELQSMKERIIEEISQSFDEAIQRNNS